MLNNISIMGRLAHTPELRETKSGTKVANLDVAVSRNRKDDSGEYPTDFFSCVAWGKTGEMISQMFKKGDTIALHGRMESRKYEAKDGSGKRTAWELNVDGWEFCGGKSSSADGKEAANAPAAMDSNPVESDNDAPF